MLHTEPSAEENRFDSFHECQQHLQARVGVSLDKLLACTGTRYRITSVELRNDAFHEPCEVHVVLYGAFRYLSFF